MALIPVEDILLTCTVDLKSAQPSTVTSVPMRAVVSVGVRAIARSVLTDVMATERATSPPAKYVTMLDATPPGQHATSTTPAATGAGSCARREMQNPVIGITVYCRMTPATILNGFWARTAKSSSFRVNPIETIETAKAMVTMLGVNARKGAGQKRAMVHETATTAAKLCERVSAKTQRRSQSAIP